MTEKEIKTLLNTINDEDWMLVISPDGQLKTVVMPKDKNSVVFTMKQILAIAESGMEEAVYQEFAEEYPALAHKLPKKPYINS
jgi:hypothetical protein